MLEIVDMKHFFLFAALLQIFFLSSAKAEFVCRVEVSYKWRSLGILQPTPAPSNKDEKNKEEKNKEEKNKDEKAANALPPEEQVFFSALEEKGESQDIAKQRIVENVTPEKEKAKAACRSSHENQATCISSKYAAMDSVLNSLDFKARTELQKAIMRDCAAQSGMCLDAIADDPQCREKVAEQKKEEAGAADAGKGKEAAKDDKKGKKK